MGRLDRSIRGYDRMARCYRWLEYAAFGSQLQTARVSMLNRLPSVENVLVLGDGDGRFLQQLCRARPACRVTSVDQSSRMLQLQRRRLTDVNPRPCVSFVRSDAKEYQPEKDQLDLLVTAFFLDCFTEDELSDMLPSWLTGVRPGGFLYYVDFCRPKSGWRRFRADCYLGLMHSMFRWSTGLPNRRLIDLDAVLARQPMSLIASEELSHGLITARLYRVE
jgi:ubiquinone/menaquinone biosynthesis C-methylase UbiE